MAAAGGRRWRRAAGVWPSSPTPGRCLPFPLQSRAYHGLWGGLFKQQQQQQQQPQQPASTAATAASAALKETLADLHSRLLDRLDSGRSSTSTDNHEDGKQRGSPFSSSSMDALFQEHLNLTLSLLGPHNSSSPLGLPRLHEGLQDALAALDPRKADPQQLATLAAIHGWALGALLATTGGGGTGGASTRSAGSSNTGSALEEVGSGGLEHGGAQRIPGERSISFRQPPASSAGPVSPAAVSYEASHLIS